MRRNVVVWTVLLIFVAAAGCGDDQPGTDPAPVCNDGTAAGEETCDGADLRGETCVSRGFDGGELACATDCRSFDESACTRCGDGACDGAEDAQSCAEDCFVPGLAFAADKSGDDVGLELFVADDAGAVAVNLSGPLLAGTSVEELAWSPDRRWIAYIANNDADGVVELYVVPARGGDPVKLASDSVVPSFAWAPDSSRIAYLHRETDGARELHTALPTGGGTVSISGSLLLGDSVGNFAWAPNSSRIAFVVGGTFGTYLKTTLPAGGGDGSIFGGMLSVSSLFSWAWAPDSSRIAFIATTDSMNMRELYTALAAGGGTVKVSGPLVADGNVDAFAWAPDSSRIAYIADQDTDGIVALYTSLPAGGGNVNVSGTATGSVFGPRWAPDSTRIAYGIGTELFTCTPTGGEPDLIDGTASDMFDWAPDSSRIAYLSYRGSGAELYTSLPAGEDAVRITDNIDTYAWSPDSSRLLYDRGRDLQTSKATGGDEIAISMVSDYGNPGQFAWAPDGAHIAFHVSNAAEDIDELHVSKASGGGSTKVSGSLNRNVARYSWAPR